MSETINDNVPEEKPLGVLFGVLAYKDMVEYEGFLDRLMNKSPTDTLLVIQSALRYAQARGAFGVEESEVVSIVLRKMINQ